MSVETRLPTLRLEFRSQESELLNTPCAKCNHALQNHSRVRSPVCAGAGRWVCKCKGFADIDVPALFDA